MCFYREMSEIAKTGLQFVFPLYLWLLMFIIIMVGKHYIRSRKSTHSAVPVLATLILLSYSKILRTTINVFSSVTVHYSTKNSNFSRSQQFIAWQPDPNIVYLEGTHAHCIIPSCPGIYSAIYTSTCFDFSKGCSAIQEIELFFSSS